MATATINTSQPATAPKTFLATLDQDARITAGLKDNLIVRRDATMAWLEKIGQNIDHPEFTKGALAPLRVVIVLHTYNFVSYALEQMGKADIKKNAKNLAIIARACHFAAKYVPDGARKPDQKVCFAEEIGGVVQTLDQRNDLRNFPSNALLDMAATLRHVCTKLPDSDLSDIAALSTWKNIIGILCDRTQTLQINPWDYAPNRTLLEIRAMKTYVRGIPDEEAGRVDELSSLSQNRRTELISVQSLERRVIDAPGLIGGTFNTVAMLFGKGRVQSRN